MARSIGRGWGRRWLQIERFATYAPAPNLVERLLSSIRVEELADYEVNELRKRAEAAEKSIQH